MSEPLLEVSDVSVEFPLRGARWFGKKAVVFRAVDRVSFTLDQGEVLGLVGESGCGKSTLARAVLRLVPCAGGSLRFKGMELSHLSGRAFRQVRLNMQMIFQDPYASLNPRYSVFSSIAEPLFVHRRSSRRETVAEVVDLMEKVGLDKRFQEKAPHELSGGQRQRVVIARALALRPDLLIADEPVSALDVSVQAQILNLLRSLCRSMSISMLFISHDLSVVKHVVDRVAVMYLGSIVEMGDAEELFQAPSHPYTETLLQAALTPDPAIEQNREPFPLRGEPPSIEHPPEACAFHPRCPFCQTVCAKERPPLESVSATRISACHFAQERIHPHTT